MKVVILGKGLMLANIILGVLDSGAEIAGVFRYEQLSNSRLKQWFSDFFVPSYELTVIKQNRIPQIRMKSANSESFRKLLIGLNVDLIIVGTWPEKIKKETFNIPKIAAVNIHPSLLPKYRGPNPYTQTILHGEKESGITLHLIDENFDTGAILKQEKVLISDTDTAKELREKTTAKARILVKEFINDLNEKILAPVNQDERYATYFPQISGKERMLDFTMQTSDDVSRTIRALHPFLPCYITYKNQFYIVNPYRFKILVEKYDKKPGTIIYKNKNNSMKIVCKDGIAIAFYDLKLYRQNIIKELIKNITKGNKLLK